MSYDVEITRSAEKFLKRQQRSLQDRFINKIFALSADPRPAGCKQLRNSRCYRIRIGDYRIIYEINDPRKTVLVLDIGHRKDIYN